MISQKIFNGKMNSDVSEYMLPSGDYLYAMNLRIGSSDGQDVGSVVNVKSNKVIPIPDSLQYLFDTSDGEVKIKTIGSGVAEDVKKVFWFVYRSDSRDFILEFDAQGEIISKILVNLDDTGGVDVTKFSTRNRIFSIDLIDGKYLKWTDNNTGPASIDIDKLKSEYYGEIKDEYIRAAKIPPLVQPSAVYISDTAVKSNRLKKKLYQFQYLFVYDDNGRSAYSPMSLRPIPSDEVVQATDTDPTKNNGIRVVFNVGGKAVKGIEVIARDGLNDWYLIASFLKSDIASLDQFGLSVDPNFSPDTNDYSFTFYNEGNYNNVDQAEEILNFDNIPDRARTQAYVSGSMVYAGITEGKDPVLVEGIVYPTYTSDANPTGKSIKSWKTNSRYEFGLIYYDGYDKSGTINTRNSFKITTKPFSQANDTTRVGVSWNITHSPPSWAVKYQWARTEQLTHQSWLFWTAHSVSAVSQDTLDYYDIFIDTLESFNRANKGSVLTYAFTKGDRVTIHRPDLSSDPIQDYDVEIVEFAVYTPPTPPATISTDPLYRLRIVRKTGVTLGAGALLEIYTPKKAPLTGDPKNLFTEFGEVFDITNPGTTSAAHSVSEGSFAEGDVYYRERKIPAEAPNDDVNHVYDTHSEWIEDPGFSDFYKSNYNSNGRPNIVDKNNKRIERPTAFRFSEVYLPETEINGLSRYYPLSIEEYDRAYGPVQRIEPRDNYLIAFQRLKTGAIPVYGTIVEQQTGASQLVLSEKLLNKIRYYFGDYGIGDNPTSLARSEGYIYFTDARRGVVLRLDGSGINPVSKESYMDNFFNSLLKSYARGNQNINGGFEKRFDEYILSFENEDVNILDETSFWYVNNPISTIDKSTFEIISSNHGTMTVNNGIGRYIPTVSYTGAAVVSYKVKDIFGTQLPNTNLCFNIIHTSDSVTWVGINPKCYTVSDVTKKYYLSRELDDAVFGGPYLCNGSVITQQNYDPTDPTGSMADPDYVEEVSDDCFCLGECDDTITNTFINDSQGHFYINEGQPDAYALGVASRHTFTYTNGSLYYTIKFNVGDPTTYKLYQYDCATVDPMTVTPLFTMHAGITYYVRVLGGDTIFISAAISPTVETC